MMEFRNAGIRFAHSFDFKVLKIILFDARSVFHKNSFTGNFSKGNDWNSFNFPRTSMRFILSAFLAILRKCAHCGNVIIILNIIIHDMQKTDFRACNFFCFNLSWDKWRMIDWCGNLDTGRIIYNFVSHSKVSWWRRRQRRRWWSWSWSSFTQIDKIWKWHSVTWYSRSLAFIQQQRPPRISISITCWISLKHFVLALNFSHWANLCI